VAHESRLFLTLLFIAITLTCPALFDHHRPRSTIQTPFSFREAGSQPAGDFSHHSAFLETFAFDSLRRRKRLIDSKGDEALDNPEHGDAADGVGRDEFGPARKWNADTAREDDQEHHHTDEQEMAGLDAQAEEG